MTKKYNHKITQAKTQLDESLSVAAQDKSSIAKAEVGESTNQPESGEPPLAAGQVSNADNKEPPARAPAPAHLPPSMLHSVKHLPNQDERLILFTRHSLRERSNGQGFASYDLPLTP